MERTEISHPAKYSQPILDLMASLIFDEIEWAQEAGSKLRILDPFAGTGRIHELEVIDQRIETTGVEIEPEWAAMGPPCPACDGAGQGWVMRGPNDPDVEDCGRCKGSGAKTMVGNALCLPSQWTDYFHIVCTSPTYGNRMADHHDAKDDSKRMTYKHTLGRDLHPDNSGQLHFGPKYKKFHQEAWKEVTRVLKNPFGKHVDPYVPGYQGGLFVLNVSDFMKGGSRIEVCQWHVDTILNMGYDLEVEYPVPTRRMKFGQNHSARVPNEMVYVFRKTGNR